MKGLYNIDYSLYMWVLVAPQSTAATAIDIILLIISDPYTLSYIPGAKSENSTRRLSADLS